MAASAVTDHPTTGSPVPGGTRMQPSARAALVSTFNSQCEWIGSRKLNTEASEKLACKDAFYALHLLSPIKFEESIFQTVRRQDERCKWLAVPELTEITQFEGYTSKAFPCLAMLRNTTPRQRAPCGAADLPHDSE
ncbi:hypothetical protein E4U55_006605 [Claviceps digitariae]|nr:hypothetical protein E4U55_006605 [Claviceps digitariae]